MTANRATGSDDPVLAETSWPLPDRLDGDGVGVEWRLRYADPDPKTRMEAAEILAAYRALIEDGTTAQQTRRLAALRRVHRRRSRR